MSTVDRIPRWIWRLLRLPPILVYRIGLGPIFKRRILLLITKGRRTGNWRTTPLQYEQIGEAYYVGAARGIKSDWLRNIRENPQVRVRVGSKHFQALAEIVEDPLQIADFLMLKFQQHPRFVGTIMQLEGYPKNPDRTDLEAYARKRVMVVLKEQPTLIK